MTIVIDTMQQVIIDIVTIPRILNMNLLLTLSLLWMTIVTGYQDRIKN